MALLKAEKVVASLPATLTPSTIYCVRTGEGFDLYVSDATGQIAHKLNSAQSKLDFDSIRSYRIPESYFPNELKTTSEVEVEKIGVVIGSSVQIILTCLRGSVPSENLTQGQSKIWKLVSTNGKIPRDWEKLGAVQSDTDTATNSNSNTRTTTTTSTTTVENDVLVGPGRPDKPTTTVVDGKQKITNDLKDGTVYESTDGAGVGAWQWQKRKGVWVVVSGDTGLIRPETKNLKPGAYIKLRRQGNFVTCHMGGLAWGLFGYLGKSEKDFRPRQSGRIDVIGQGYIPLGFRADDSCVFNLFDDDTGRPVAGVYVGGVKDSNFMRFTPYHEDPKVRGDAAIPNTGPSNLRPQSMLWTTSDPWPDRV